MLKAVTYIIEEKIQHEQSILAKKELFITKATWINMQ